jgi:hypothetical protein
MATNAMLTIDIYGVSWLDAFEERKHPRAKGGKHGGEFVKGSGGGGSRSSEWSVPSRPGYDDVNAVMASKVPPQEKIKRLRQIQEKDPENIGVYANGRIRKIKEQYGIKEWEEYKQEAQAKQEAKPEAKQEPKAPEPAKAEPKREESKPQETAGELTPNKPASREMREQAFAKKKGKEKEFHDRAWLHSSEQMTQIIQNRHNLSTVTEDSATTSFYRSTTGGINMSPRNRGGAKDAVWRHEFGHAVDFGHGTEPRSGRLMPTIREEGDLIVSRSRGGAASGQKMTLPKEELANFPEKSAEALRKVLEDDAPINDVSLGKIGRGAEARFLNDFFGAMTLLKVGEGHSHEYYAARSNRRSTEAFANYVCLTEGQNGHAYRLLLHHAAPKTCAGFDEILRDRAAGK